MVRTPVTPRRSPLRHLRASDLRGAAGLATEAAVAVSRVAEGVHRSVHGVLGLSAGAPPGRTGGLTGWVYQSVRGVAQWLGGGAERLLGALQPALEAAEAAAPESPEREAVLAALNGVMGDRLAASGSPFATPMTLRSDGVVRVAPDGVRAMPPAAQARGHLLLLLHGLCMNDLQWHPSRAGEAVDHGQVLAEALAATLVHGRYNSGLHTSQNGHELARQLDRLVAAWPVPVESITVLAHSMGGLVMRSACHAAAEAGLPWLGRLRHIVFLGTPHHGAPLERAGHGLDLLLDATPWTAPFARLGRLRSAGITDLRYGHTLDADWQGHDRFRRSPDRRQPLPLPPGVACYAVAACLAPRRGPLAERLVGDGLVPLRSALGEHDDPRLRLDFPKPRQWIAYRMGHLDLLRRPEVTQQLLHWLAPGPAPA